MLFFLMAWICNIFSKSKTVMKNITQYFQNILKGFFGTYCTYMRKGNSVTQEGNTSKDFKKV